MVQLRQRLETACRKGGVVIFRVASAEEADRLETVKIIDPSFEGMSEKVTSVMPIAKSVIVFGIMTFDDAEELSVRKSENEWDYPGYHPLSHISRDLIEILNKEGYSAMPPPESVARKQISRLAGVGVYGKNSMILSEEYGLSLRLEIVLTDAMLEKDIPLDKDLCGECRLCVDSCPTNALKPYVLDIDRCLVHIAEAGTPDEELKKAVKKHTKWLTPNTILMCTICQMACPYTSEERKKNRMRL